MASDHGRGGMGCGGCAVARGDFSAVWLERGIGIRTVRTPIDYKVAAVSAPWRLQRVEHFAPMRTAGNPIKDEAVVSGFAAYIRTQPNP